MNYKLTPFNKSVVGGMPEIKILETLHIMFDKEFE